MLAVVAAIAVVVAGYRAYSRPALDPGDYGTTSGAKIKIGEIVNFGVLPFKPKSRHTVHVRAVRVTGVPRGMRVVAVRAVRLGDGGGGFIGARSGDVELQDGYWQPLHPVPVTRMTFRKGDEEEWYVLVSVTGTEPGKWKATGIDVDWTSWWWRRGTTHYNYEVEVDATVNGP